MQAASVPAQAADPLPATHRRITARTPPPSASRASVAASTYRASPALSIPLWPGRSLTVLPLSCSLPQCKAADNGSDVCNITGRKRTKRPGQAV